MNVIRYKMKWMSDLLEKFPSSTCPALSLLPSCGYQWRCPASAWTWPQSVCTPCSREPVSPPAAAGSQHLFHLSVVNVYDNVIDLPKLNLIKLPHWPSLSLV